MSKEFVKQLEELTEIAKEFKKYSKERNGWDTQEYYDPDTSLNVRCYFADKSDHTSVDFDGKMGGGVGISFFSDVQYEFNTRAVGRIETITKNAKDFLKRLQKAQDNEDEAEALKRKEDRKQTLLNELKELESPSHEPTRHYQ